MDHFVPQLKLQDDISILPTPMVTPNKQDQSRKITEKEVNIILNAKTPADLCKRPELKPFASIVSSAGDWRQGK